MEHLAIMDKDTIDMILSGDKLIESRFSKNKITPFNRVKVDEVVYLKESGKDVIASFEIAKVLFFDSLTKDKVLEIINKYDDLIKGPKIYWKEKLNSNYGTLMYIKNVKKINPIKVNKKGRQGFVSLNKIQDLCKLT